MRKYLLTAAAAAAIATPAAVAARDHSGYVGIEGGILWPNKSADLHVDAAGTANSGGLGYYLYYSANNLFSTNLRSKYKSGLDVDAVAGYDFGYLRVEGEIGYKRAKHGGLTFPDFNGGSTGNTAFPAGDVNLGGGGRTTAWTGMLNALADFGNDNGLSFSVGGGVGYGKFKSSFSTNNPDAVVLGSISTSINKSKFAYQLLAEARYAVSPQIDVGLK